jgi:outer membrane protein assembly factor BamE
MSRNQVKDILGTPLIASVFHSDRWDYAFTIVRKGTQPQQRQLSVYFKDDLYVRFEGDDLPSESEFAERIAVPEDRKVVPRLEATSKEFEKFQKNAPAPVSATPKPTALPDDKAYPPLETP